MKKKNLFTMLSMSALMLSAAPAVAQPGPGAMGMRGKGARLERIKQKLGLTDDQVAQIKALRSSHRSQMTSTREQLIALRQQMHEVLGAPVVDQAKAMTLFKQQQAYKQLAQEARFKHRLQVLQVLSPEQRQLMLQMRGKGRFGKGHFGRGRGGRGWGRGGPAQ
ncbi:MAG: Spy/CpxP family protein refolding chaperone [Deltaproteobacteria bacterium]|jgi:Spy/CpxP family protein refolding chaperone|nr:Spy/CpxP family protein refolding chaperone [Deltaproteobacteria bacterium]